MKTTIEVHEIDPGEALDDACDRLLWKGRRNSLKNRLRRAWWRVSGMPDRVRWLFAHRFIPWHRYNIVRTGLQPGYYDPDVRILNATFHLLTEYVDNNRKWGIIHWDSTPEQAATWAEMNALRDWWAIERPAKLAKIADAWAAAKTSAARDAVWEAERAADEEDDANLARVAKVRRAMWYA